MSLSGHLSELALPDLLQIVAMAEKSGRLDLTTRDGESLIVFRVGRIIYAASNAARETLGSILVHRRLISEETLRRALERQYRSREERRLGSILVQMGALSQKMLEEVILEQVERVIAEVVKWRDGYFKFEAIDIPDRGEVAVDAREFLAEPGFNTQRIALEISRLSDESIHAAAPAAPSPPAGRPRAEAAAESSAPHPAPPATPLASLGAILAAQPHTSLTAEATMAILRSGGAVFSRAVLLLVERYGLAGVGCVGVRDGDATVDEGIRNLWFPLDAPSVLTEVAVSGRSYRGVMERTDATKLLVGELDGTWPAEVAVLPVRVGGRVAAILYGDTMPAGTPIGDLSRLESSLLQAGAGVHGAGSAPVVAGRS